MPKRVLLTGGAGSIGSHVLAHIMHNTNWNVTILDSFRHKGYHARIQGMFNSHPEWEQRTEVIQHDLSCAISPELSEKIGEVAHILHLAAMSDVFFSVENPLYVIQNNINSTMTMLEYAKRTPHETFIYFSTDEVYGPVEANGKPHQEGDSHRPSNAYAASKAMGEDAAYCYWRSGWVKLIRTNTMNNFSEFQSASKFPVIVQKKLMKDEVVTIHGTKEEIGSRYYIHSRNVADALLFILNNLPPREHQQGQIDEPDQYHIVGSKKLTNLEMAQLIAKLMGKKLKYKLEDFHSSNFGHDIHYGMADNKLAKAGWVAPLTLEESLKKTIEWQMEHPEWIE